MDAAHIRLVSFLRLAAQGPQVVEELLQDAVLALLLSSESAHGMCALGLS